MKRFKDIIYLTFMSLLVMAGLVMVMSPWIKNQIVEEVSQTLTITEFTREELAANNTQTGGIPFGAEIEVLDFQTVVMGVNQINREDVIGAIAIYELDMLVPILNGTTSENLIVGATTMIEGQAMGTGNYALAGHHMADASLLFGPLLQAEPGMRVQITDKNTLYTYEVTEAFMIEDTEFWILDETEVPTLTLMTCDIPGVTPNRWVVRAQLISEVPYDDEEAEEVQAFTQVVATTTEQTTVVMRYALIAPVALVPVLFFGSYALKNKKK